MCNRKELRFSVYIIHHLAHAWEVSPANVYKPLNDTYKMVDDILGCYDTLHTQGEQALVNDITDFVREKGFKI